MKLKNKIKYILLAIIVLLICTNSDETHATKFSYSTLKSKLGSNVSVSVEEYWRDFYYNCIEKGQPVYMSTGQTYSLTVSYALEFDQVKELATVSTSAGTENLYGKTFTSVGRSYAVGGNSWEQMVKLAYVANSSWGNVAYNPDSSNQQKAVWVYGADIVASMIKDATGGTYSTNRGTITVNSTISSSVNNYLNTAKEYEEIKNSISDENLIKMPEVLDSVSGAVGGQTLFGPIEVASFTGIPEKVSYTDGSGNALDGYLLVKNDDGSFSNVTNLSELAGKCIYVAVWNDYIEAGIDEVNVKVSFKTYGIYGFKLAALTNNVWGHQNLVRIEPIGITYDAPEFSFEIPLDVPEEIEIEVYKTAKSVDGIVYGQALEGVEFMLSTTPGDAGQIATGYTDKDGKLTFTTDNEGVPLKNGESYYVREVSLGALNEDKYILDTTWYDVAVTGTSIIVGNKAIKKLDIENEPVPGKVELILDKYTKNEGGTETRLEGITFELYDSNDTLLEVGTTNSGGYIRFETELIIGQQYYVVETNLGSLTGQYVLLEEPYEFTATENMTIDDEKVCMIWVKNEPDDSSVSLKVYKKDGTDKVTMIPGVTFALYTSDNSYYQEKTTGTDGTCSFSKLEIGTTYWLKEIGITGAYADDYKVDSTPKMITVTEDNFVYDKVIETTVYNDRTIEQKLVIKKRDYDNTDLIVPDVTFTLQVSSLSGWTTQSKTLYSTDGSKEETRYIYASDLKGAYVKNDGTIDWEWASSTTKRVKIGEDEDGIAIYETRECWSSSEKVVIAALSSSHKLTVDSNGEIALDMEYAGKYTLKEISTGSGAQDLGYTNDLKMYLAGSTTGYTELTITVSSTGTSVEYEILNQRDGNLEISGQIWIDEGSGKATERDNLMGSTNDIVTGSDLDNVEVRLYSGSTSIATTYTSEGGKYEFNEENTKGKLKISDAREGNLRVEFEFNGLKYAAVDVKDTLVNGSKASEDLDEGGVIDERKEFDKNFTTITGTAHDVGTTNAKIPLYYDVDKTPYASTLTEEYHYLGWDNSCSLNSGEVYEDAKSNLSMYAKTSTKYIQTAFYAAVNEMTENGTVEIKNVNFGVYVKEQADVRLLKDLEKVKITFNGYEHTYNYSIKTTEIMNNGDFGVSFFNPYLGTYSRAVYKADVIAPSDLVSNTFRMDVTYAITVINDTTTLQQTIDQILDVYDERYKFVAAGTEMAENGDVGGTKIELGSASKEGQIILETTSALSKIPGTSSSNSNYKTIYLQFYIDANTSKELLESGSELTNHAEILKYSTYTSSGGVYSAVDEDSNPGSFYTAISKNDINGYHQDDSDYAPGFTLEESGDPRSLIGVVFEDAAIEPGEWKIREGDGIYDEGSEGTVQDVKVELILQLANGTEKVMDTVDTTDAEGKFGFTDYFAGDYIVRYTWGDANGNIDVREYKATIYNGAMRKNYGLWFIDLDTRNSDAMDNLETRYQIDYEIKNQGNETTTMTSETPLMNIGVEYEDTTGENISGVEVDTYNIQNIDFGIIERAKQQLEIDKEVVKFEIYLENGVKLVDFDASDYTSGSISGLQWVPGDQGFLKQEMDNEILEGATAIITYDISISNIGEKDYLDLSAEGSTYTALLNLTDREDELTSNDRYDKLNTYYTGNYKDDIDLDSYYNYYLYGAEQSAVDNDEANVIKLSSKVIDVTDGGVGLVDKATTGYDWQLIGFDDYETNYLNNELTVLEYQNYATQTTTSKATLTADEQQERRDDFESVSQSIMYSKALYEEIAPKESITVELQTSKILSNVDEHKFDNYAEIVRVHQRGGTRVQVNSTSFTSDLDDDAETVSITPPTGENRNYTEYTIIGVVAVSIIAAAAVIIKRKVIDTKPKV